MANMIFGVAVIWVAFLAVVYQFVVKDLYYGTLGYSRSFRPLSSFNVQCKKIDQLGLEACEDMWLHEKTGYLYMACGDSESKTKWLPACDFPVIILIDYETLTNKVSTFSMPQVAVYSIVWSFSILEAPAESKTESNGSQLPASPESMEMGRSISMAST
jgi:hypothetical protein